MNNHPIIEIDAHIVPAAPNFDILEYADNPQARCPVVLLLDTSTSMQGAPIHELRRAVSQFYEELATSTTVSGSAEICVISFGYNGVSIESGFSPINTNQDPPQINLQAGGMTPMGAAIELAISECQQREQYYQRQGVSAYKPIIVLMTDGGPNDNWHEPVERLGRMAQNGEIITVPVGIGEHANMDILNRIAGPRMAATRLQGLNFQNFFQWLSSSIKNIVSGSSVNQNNMQSTQYYNWDL